MYPNLKLQLWMSGIRQNRLAKMLDMDETTLSKIVNGFRQPTPEIRGRIAAALKSDENWLFQTVAEKLQEEERRQKTEVRSQKPETGVQAVRHGTGA
jgi:transcriptional regulator with XRE-family HTH domain